MQSDDSSTRKRACVHLLEAKGADHYQRFTGSGLGYDLVCSKCKAAPADIESNLRDVGVQCFDEIEQEGYWDGIVGQPETLSRVTSLRFEHQSLSMPELQGLRFLDVQPVASLPHIWFGLSSDGRLTRVDLNSRSVIPLLHLPEGTIDLSQESMLRMSRDGALIAVVNTKGQHGVVVDAASGQPTLSLDRGNYHEDVSTFPVAFVEQGEKTLVIHGTSWNRLDVSDAKTGQLLTERSPTAYKRGEERPPHYLDYFHCGLTVSPHQEVIVDNGWVWHPSGVVATWSLRSWLHDNVWESEDGPSKKYLCQRAYFWDGPLCWLDDRRLAVWGYGNDDEWLIPAVCIFDVVTGKLDRWFPGPKGKLAFDEYLFSWDQSGLTVWDVETGERLTIDDTLIPTGYHPAGDSFLTLQDGGMVRLSRLVQ